MNQLEPSELIRLIKITLDKSHVDYEGMIKTMGQTKTCKDRISQKVFPLKEHVRALVLSLLSSQRPWTTIAARSDDIHCIFHEFDITSLLKTPPDEIIVAIRKKKCGNMAIKKQISTLSYNINIFKEIEKKCGSIDSFIGCHKDAFAVAQVLSIAGSEFKLKQVGIPLAMEYLKNVGVNTIKPDVHLQRILSRNRLGYIADKPTARKVFDVASELAGRIDAECSCVYLDNLLWLFCAKGYGEICGATPKCSCCELTKHCNYPHEHQGAVL